MVRQVPFAGLLLLCLLVVSTSCQAEFLMFGRFSILLRGGEGGSLNLVRSGQPMLPIRRVPQLKANPPHGDTKDLSYLTPSRSSMCYIRSCRITPRSRIDSSGPKLNYTVSAASGAATSQRIGFPRLVFTKQPDNATIGLLTALSTARALSKFEVLMPIRAGDRLTEPIKKYRVTNAVLTRFGAAGTQDMESWEIGWGGKVEYEYRQQLSTGQLGPARRYCMDYARNVICS